MALNIRTYLEKLKIWAPAHKKSSFLILLIILLASYWLFSRFTASDEASKYVVANVSKETLITSISASGQVSATNQVDIKPKVTGDVVYVGVKAGDKVKKGTLLVQLDATEAQKAVRDAQVNLESAQIANAKLLQPADALSVTQSENTLARAKESKANAEVDLVEAYEDGFNDVSNAFLELPSIITGLQDMLFTISSVSSGGDGNQQNIDFYTSATSRYDDRAESYRRDAYDKYQKARAAYDKNFQNYKLVTRYSSKQQIEETIQETYETTRLISDSIKSTNNLIQFYKDRLGEHSLRTSPLADTHLTLLTSYTSKANTHLSSLLSVASSIQTNKDAIVNAERSIDENTKSLEKLRRGTDELDLASSELSLKQRQNALYDAQQKLADYFIRSPFDGAVAKVSVKVGDQSGSASAVATVITPQQIAVLSVNEVDAAKLRVGQKATLTFDAIEDLSISGEVSEVDAVGTVTQGVVSYTVKISFDTQDERVKPGMTVSASVVTNVAIDVLTVPNSAIKSAGESSYVEVFESPLKISEDTDVRGGVASAQTPIRKSVTIGNSNDLSTEITSGLNEGDQIIVRTITATTQTTTSAPSIFGATGGNRNTGVRGIAP